MGTPADTSVSLQQAPLRGIAAVRARLPISRVPASFTTYLNQVYTAARNGAIPLDGQNIFVYRGGASGEDADVDFGVGVRSPFEPHGAVTYCELPTGDVAVATHWGDYATARRRAFRRARVVPRERPRTDGHALGDLRPLDRRPGASSDGRLLPAALVERPSDVDHLDPWLARPTPRIPTRRRSRQASAVPRCAR